MLALTEPLPPALTKPLPPALTKALNLGSGRDTAAEARRDSRRAALSPRLPPPLHICAGIKALLWY